MTLADDPREPESLPEALEMLRHADPRRRALAAKALGRQGADVRAAVPDVLRVLLDPDPMVRSMAAAALGRIGDPAAVDGLLLALSDPLVPVRFWAAEALGRLAPARADVRAALARLAEGDEAHVRTAAARSLAGLPPAAGADAEGP
jgi:HEAT repeat protein